LTSRHTYIGGNSM